VGLSVSAAPILAASPVTMLITPAGIPARLARTPSANAEYGVNSDGLMTTVQPAARAGAALRVIIALGKFQGVIAATTPIGCFCTRMRPFAEGDEIVSPWMHRASSANHLMKEAP
jgi:hypothetical protein